MTNRYQELSHNPQSTASRFVFAVAVGITITAVTGAVGFSISNAINQGALAQRVTDDERNDAINAQDIKNDLHYIRETLDQQKSGDGHGNGPP